MEINIEERVSNARALHRSGYNCAQAVVLAYADVLPIDAKSAAMVAAGFGRGVAGLREVCGCVSGMAMVAGLVERSAEVKALAELFREENGDINCGRLLQSGKRPCNDLVACAARLLGKALCQ